MRRAGGGRGRLRFRLRPRRSKRSALVTLSVLAFVQRMHVIREPGSGWRDGRGDGLELALEERRTRDAVDGTGGLLFVTLLTSKNL